jgi:YHS domain-containing protein
MGWRFLTTGGPAMLRMMEAPAKQRQGFTDPVCGMAVSPSDTTERFEYKGKMYYFCSPGCRAAFMREPERYVGADSKPAGHSGH